MCKDKSDESYQPETSKMRKLEGLGGNAEKFLDLADEAWHELLKEKLKEEIDRQDGECIEKLAKIVAETHKAKWKHINADKQCVADYLYKLRDLSFEF